MFESLTPQSIYMNLWPAVYRPSFNLDHSLKRTYVPLVSRKNVFNIHLIIYVVMLKAVLLQNN